MTIAFRYRPSTRRWTGLFRNRGGSEVQFSPRAIVGRNDAAVRSLEELPREICAGGRIRAPVSIHLNGFRMEADLTRGQKTGVFLDQRENYLAAARYARGKALDCFTVDRRLRPAPCPHLRIGGSHRFQRRRAGNCSAKRRCQRHFERRFSRGGCLRSASSYASARRTFDTVVLDPPAFAKSRKQIEGALRGYKDMNLRALRLLGPGGSWSPAPARIM